MADIIRLRGSPHEQTQGLISWHANGTLDEDERAQVEAHLIHCAECRADLELEHAMAAQIASLPIDQEHGWSAIAARLDAPPPRHASVTLFRRRVPLGWAMAGPLAAIAATAMLFLNIVPVSSPPAAPPVGAYRALGAAEDARTGNLVVIFHPETSEREMRKVLIKADAHVIDGPNASGAYVLEVPPSARDRTVKALRGMTPVLLAEPVDADRRR